MKGASYPGIVTTCLYPLPCRHREVFGSFDKRRETLESETSDSFAKSQTIGIGNAVLMNRSAPVGHSQAVMDDQNEHDSVRVQANPSESVSEPGELPSTSTSTRREEKSASPIEEKSSSPGEGKPFATTVQETEAAAPSASTSDPMRADTMSEPSQESIGAAAGGETVRLGYHALNSLDGTDIPEYVREHNATLSFPEKVSVHVHVTVNSIPRLYVLNSVPNALWLFLVLVFHVAHAHVDACRERVCQIGAQACSSPRCVDARWKCLFYSKQRKARQ